MRVALLSEHAKLPTRATDGSAGYDLYAMEGLNLFANKQQLVDTGVAVEIPLGHVGIIKSRSSMAVKFSVEVGAGVIDSDYRGSIKVLLYNRGSVDCHIIERGDRIAQLLIIPIATPSLCVVKHLQATERNQGGFGSTGK